MLQFLDKEIDDLFLKLMALGDGDATVEVTKEAILQHLVKVTQQFCHFALQQR
jgi:hypothetical protein